MCCMRKQGVCLKSNRSNNERVDSTLISLLADLIHKPPLLVTAGCQHVPSNRSNSQLTSDTQQGHRCRIWSNSSSKVVEPWRSSQPSCLLHSNLRGGVVNGVSHRLHRTMSSQNCCDPGGAHRVLSKREHAPAEIRYNWAALVASSRTARRWDFGHQLGDRFVPRCAHLFLLQRRFLKSKTGVSTARVKLNLRIKLRLMHRSVNILRPLKYESSAP